MATAQVEILPVEALTQKIRAKNAVVGVIGAGYVGLPLAVEEAKAGFTVWCVDSDRKRVEALKKGESYILDVKDADLGEARRTGRLKASNAYGVLASCDVIVVCVPTPLTANREPDLQFITQVSDKVAEYLHPGQLVCLESTTYPGTTEEVVLPRLEESGLTAGRDFFLAFSPERVDPGNRRFNTKNTNKLVGGVTKACLDVATEFYSQTILKVIPVSSPRVAEMAKVSPTARSTSAS